jgi:predicted transglutaminase-like cysteine proteinase
MGTKGRFALAAATAGMVIAGAATAFAQSMMPTGGLSTQPVGHYQFCQQYQDECTRTTNVRPVELTRPLWAKIVEINNLVNTSVTPRTDAELWGIEERWTYPVDGYGDCEDYALEKRRLLIKAGVPASNLLVTVVRQPNGDGHAVLTVSTHLGDFVLDNLEPRVLAWTETEYQFLKRQSAKHAGMWVSIQDGRNVLVGSVGTNR